MNSDEVRTAGPLERLVMPHGGIMKSIAVESSAITLPLIDGEFSMMPFDLASLAGLSDVFAGIAESLLAGVRHAGGVAFLTVHGKRLTKGQTLRRGGPHTDGSYDASVFDWGGGGGGGWKVGENGPPVSSADHQRLYAAETGGIILASNFEACLGWIGEFDGSPAVGGDCSGIQLNEPFTLKRNVAYYGNNHFIHESLPMSADVHRVFARITLPQSHVYANAA